MTLALQLVCFLASSQSLKTGRPRCVVPAFFGETPPTIFVPYLRACSVWKVPYLTPSCYLVACHALANDSSVLIDPDLWCSTEEATEGSRQHKILSKFIYQLDCFLRRDSWIFSRKKSFSLLLPIDFSPSLNLV